MFPTPALYHYYPYALRVGLLFALIFLTFRYTKRGIQNGILIGLVTAMSPIPLTLFERFGPIPDVSLDRVVWPIVLIVFFLKRRQGETDKVPLDWIECSILGFTAIVLLSLISYGSYAGKEGWNLFGIIRGYAFPFMAYSIARRGIKTAQQLHAFFVGLGFIALYLVFTGVAETLRINWLIFPQFILRSDLGIHFGKVRGIFLNASHNGLAIAMALPFLVWLSFKDRTPRRWLWPVVAALAIVPVAYTMQRAAWLSTATALAMVTLTWPRRRIVLIGLAVYVAAAGFLFKSDALTQKLETRLEQESTIDWRIERIEAGWAVFRANPLLGVGINRYNMSVDEYISSRSQDRNRSNAHNTWITLLAELGLLGTLSYGAIFGFVLFESIKSYWRYPRYRVILGILMGITLAFVVMSISLEIRSVLYPNAFLYAIWGMILAAVRRGIAAGHGQAFRQGHYAPASLLKTEVATGGAR
jgi:O-antigen ligase